MKTVMLSHNRRKDLNKILAQWAGFDLIQKGDFDFFCRKGDKNSFYLDFVGSLSNCYEWLVPKMKNFSLIYSKEIGYTAQITLESGSRAEYFSDSPSMSLCVALESLIVAK
jgi:hypothetical protein